MEAAATRGFNGVPLSVMHRLLQDMKCPDSKRPHERAAMLIKAWKEKWGWAQVDVARAMQGVLSGSRSKAKKATPKAPEDEGELVWRDITSVIAALNATDVEVRESFSVQ